MSKEKIAMCEDLADIMPPEYHELVASATYGKEGRGWKDIGSSKELIEQHSLCAGCPATQSLPTQAAIQQVVEPRTECEYLFYVPSIYSDQQP